MSGVHTCSYYCERPECIKRQRDELRDRLEAALAQQPAAPSGEAVAWAAMSANGGRVVSISLERDEYVGHVVPLYAAPQQPAAGEEIMVNAAHDVYTLPLQPSGLSSGPRFVVHVPGPDQQPAAVDGMVMVQASDLKTLAEFADRGMRGNPAKLAALRAKAILAAQQQGGRADG